MADFEETDNELYLIFSAGSNKYAIPALDVREMLPPQQVVHIPEAPPWVRGVVNVRKATFTTIDFRKRVGQRSIKEENEDLFNQLTKRKKEHIQWIDQLEHSVTDNVPFQGEIDPHRCKFGRWYDNFVSPNAAIELHLKKFDMPHKAIHDTAQEVLRLKNADANEEAMDLINSRRNRELAQLIALFDSLKNQISTSYKEVIILVENEKNKYALAVDAVESVESLNAENNAGLEGFQNSESSFARHSSVSQRIDSQEIVYIVDTDWIYRGGEDIKT